MGRYTAEANTTLNLDDGQTVGPGATFETDFRPEQEVSLLAAGAIVKASEGFSAVIGAEHDCDQPAGEPGVKE